jgi:hypothetical protein
VLSTGGVEVNAEVTDLTTNQISISFAAPFSGRAIIA